MGTVCPQDIFQYARLFLYTFAFLTMAYSNSALCAFVYVFISCLSVHLSLCVYLYLCVQARSVLQKLIMMMLLAQSPQVGGRGQGNANLGTSLCFVHQSTPKERSIQQQVFPSFGSHRCCGGDKAPITVITYLACFIQTILINYFGTIKCLKHKSGASSILRDCVYRH